MPISDIRKRYLLFEAFELVGERLFGPEWTHGELNQPSAVSPDEMTKVRAPYLDSLRELESQISEIEKNIARITDAAGIATLVGLLQETKDRRIAVGIALNGHPEPGNIHEDLYANYRRKLAVEKTLITALGNGHLTAQDSYGHPIHNVLWTGHPHFGYYLALSVVRVPKSFSAKRFIAAHIEEAPFDAWLKTLEPIVPLPLPSLSLEEQCRAFLKEEVSRGEKRISRDEYLAQAQTRFPGLSERAFLHEWASAVPASWRAQGRISRKKSSRA